MFNKVTRPRYYVLFVRHQRDNAEIVLAVANPRVFEILFQWSILLRISDRINWGIEMTNGRLKMVQSFFFLFRHFLQNVVVQLTPSVFWFPSPANNWNDILYRWDTSWGKKLQRPNTIQWINLLNLLNSRTCTMYRIRILHQV